MTAGFTRIKTADIASATIVDANIASGAAIDPGKLAVTDGQLIVGSGGVGASAAMSGHATISNTGVLTIADSAVTDAKIGTSAGIAVSKLAVTTNHIVVGSSGIGSDVAMSGDIGIDASGATTIALNAVTEAKIADGSITNAKLASGFGLNPANLALADTHIIVGNGSNIGASVAVSGDISLSDTGATTLSDNTVSTGKLVDNAVTTAKITDGSVTNAKLAGSIAVGNLALTTGDIIVGSSGVGAAVAMTGDATMDSTGTVTIANSAITDAKVASTAAIALAKLAGATAGHIVIDQGSGAGVASVAMSGDGTINSSGVLTIADFNGGTHGLVPINGAGVVGSVLSDSGAWVALPGGGTPVYEEVPSGSINSSNVTFALANTPLSSSQRVYKNGLRQQAGNDYTISGSTITFAGGNIPQSGDIIVVDYAH